MTDFVDRLEKELLAAGRRPPGERLARRARATIVLAAPLILSVGVAGAVAAVILSSGHARRTSGAQRASLPVVSCWRPPVNVRSALPPTTDATPSRSLLSLLGVLRRPATAADRVSLRGLVYSPITAIYARYVRVVSDAAGERFALVPAQICGKQSGGLYPARPPGTAASPRPRDAIFIIVLRAPTPRALFNAGGASEIQAGRSIGQWWPEGDGSLIATVVPDGVGRVVFAFGSRHREVSVTVRDNLGIARPSPGVLPKASTWYAANGPVIRRFSFPSPTAPVHAATP